MGDDPVSVAPSSYTEALMNQEDYFEWCESHSPLPLLLPTFFPLSVLLFVST